MKKEVLFTRKAAIDVMGLLEALKGNIRNRRNQRDQGEIKLVVTVGGKKRDKKPHHPVHFLSWL